MSFKNDKSSFRWHVSPCDDGYKISKSEWDYYLAARKFKDYYQDGKLYTTKYCAEAQELADKLNRVK